MGMATGQVSLSSCVAMYRPYLLLGKDSAVVAPLWGPTARVSADGDVPLPDPRDSGRLT